MGFEAGLEQGEGLGLTEVLWEGVPELSVTENALSPKLRSLALGMESKPAEVDLRDRGGWERMSRSVR